MKVTAPTAFQAALIQRALDAERYSPRWKALWRGVYKQAQLTIKHHNLTWHDVELVEGTILVFAGGEETGKVRVKIDDDTAKYRELKAEDLTVIEEAAEDAPEAPEQEQKEEVQPEVEAPAADPVCPDCERLRAKVLKFCANADTYTTKEELEVLARGL